MRQASQTFQSVCLRAAAAWKNGWYDAETVPVKTRIEDKEGNSKDITVSILASQ